MPAVVIVLICASDKQLSPVSTPLERQRIVAGSNTHATGLLIMPSATPSRASHCLIHCSEKNLAFGEA